MWLKLPRSVCLPAQECLTQPSISLLEELARSCAWRGKSLRPESWRRVLKTGVFQTLLSGLTCEPLTAARFMAEWTESLAVSHAQTYPLPDAKLGSTETPVGCISSTCESFAKFSHDGSLLRTSRQFSLFQQEEPYSENLPRSGSMRNGELFERPMLARRIDATGHSFWPTSRTQDAKHGECTDYELSRDSGKDLLHVAVERLNWPTLRGEDSESCGNHPGAVDSLTGATRQWATPNAHDGRRPGVDEHSTQGGNLSRDAAVWTTPQAHDAAGGNPERVGRFGTKHGGANLADDVTLWKTPDVPNGGRTMSAEDVAANGSTDKGKRQVGLENQARFAKFAATSSTPIADATAALTARESAWPTPKARDSKSAEGEAGMMRHSTDLNVMACHSFHQAPATPPHGSESSPSGPTSRRRLNPNFVDWLMSLPPGWTDYAPVETELWFCKVRMHLESLLNELG